MTRRPTKPQILALASAGITLADAARQLNLTYHTLYMWNLRNNKPFALTKPPIKVPDLDWKNLLAKHKTIKAVAAATGCDRRTVQRRLRKLGVAKRGSTQAVVEKLSPKEAADFIFLFRRKKYTIAQALEAIKRTDLL